MFLDILVAIDDTPIARRALEHAIDLAQGQGARLTVMSVVPDIPGFAYRAGVDVAALTRHAEEDTARLVREAVDEVPPDVPVTSRVRKGPVGEQIVEQIRECRHDLVVMGSRGRGRFVTSVFGGVGAYVHFHTSIPMLVVHPDERG
jgi:nucleotide-binding universal stress UspA family protein